MPTLEIFGSWVPPGQPYAGCYMVAARCATGCHSTGRLMTEADLTLCQIDVFPVIEMRLRLAFAREHPRASSLSKEAA